MDIQVQTGSIIETTCDIVIVNLFQGVTAPGGATGAIDQALDGAITAAVNDGQFKGRLHETLVLPTFGRLPARRVLVAGLGERDKFDLVKARQVAAVAARQARATGSRKVAGVVHGAGTGGLDPTAAARALVEGTLTGLYRFEHYKTAANETPDPETFIMVEQDSSRIPLLEQGTHLGEIFAAAANLARDLTNEPPSRLTPAELGARAAAMAATEGVECKVLDASELADLGMGAVLAVGRGSSEPPAMLVLTYRGRGGNRGFDLGLVGKGVTFDSGGLSLKPPTGMETMKDDMAGAAAVVGAMLAIARLKPSVDVVAVVPAVENMPGGRAQKPGDVIETFAGKTIEVLNTDAEGRLVLADGVAYARHLGARRIVDAATLTGAAQVALGNLASALIANDQDLAAQVETAAAEAGERVWRLPAWDEYREGYRSQVADMKNTAGRWGGAITGGLIVGEFAGDTPWAHLDIAGTAWLPRSKPYAEAGGTGAAARTLAQLAVAMHR